jgi:hypothetical protein
VELLERHSHSLNGGFFFSFLLLFAFNAEGSNWSSLEAGFGNITAALLADTECTIIYALECLLDLGHELSFPIPDSQ